MHDETKASYGDAIERSITIVSPLLKRYVTPHQLWKKSGPQIWSSSCVYCPDFMRILIEVDRELQAAAEEFTSSFEANYPEYGKLVGLPGFQLHHEPDQLVRAALLEAWHRNESFKDVGEVVAQIVDEFERFIDEPQIEIQFRAVLLNFRSPCDLVELPGGVRIRRLTEHEYSEFNGGSFMDQMPRNQWVGMNEFCVEGETTATKVFGGDDCDEPMLQDRTKSVLDKVVLSLRTFKEGFVGYDTVHFDSTTFCPIPFFQSGYSDHFTPPGSFRLEDEGECRELVEHARFVFDLSEPSIEMACSRLADAETRTRASDRIVDAVIGMECVLLSALGADARRGELSYRFSLHYSTLFDSPDARFQAYRLAKDLYSLRSTVAHGSQLADKLVRVGDDKVSLVEAAKRASSTLRHLVRHFLPLSKEAPFKRHGFWERAYFGLDDA